MLRNTLRWALCLGSAAVLASGAASAQSMSDDLGPDGLKRRGDGSIDDTQPGGNPDRPGVNDDVGADGLKRRGDGSIDDTQPGAGDRPAAGDFVRTNKVDDRFVDTDGNRVRQRVDTHVNPVTGVTRERERTRTQAPDGTRSEVRTERFIDADGNLISESVRERGADDPADRAERADRPERAERGDRAERPERADRPERVERPERTERPERAERADRSG